MLAVLYHYVPTESGREVTNLATTKFFKLAAIYFQSWRVSWMKSVTYITANIGWIVSFVTNTTVTSKISFTMC